MQLNFKRLLKICGTVALSAPPHSVSLFRYQVLKYQLNDSGLYVCFISKNSFKLNLENPKISSNSVIKIK